MTDASPTYRGWDFWLTVATVVLLGGVGLQSFVGTLYVWWASNAMPGWDNSPGYLEFVNVMNAIAAPQIVGLVVVMGLCVPKRLFTRSMLLWSSMAMLFTGVGVWAYTASVADGVAAYLVLAALIQVAVVVITVAGVRGPSYLTRGRLTKTGSGLLHLGFILFALVIVALQESALMLPVFWTASTLMISGTLLSFYADKLSVRRYRRIELPEDDETTF
ncbi:MAG: hypothetical protein ACYC6C_09310 [Coriobacteriia bacterium]